MAFELIANLGKFRPRAEWAGYQHDGRKWTSSSNLCYWNEAVLYCADRNTKLCTLGELVGFRQVSGGTDNSNELQHSSTLIGLITESIGVTRAFLWEPSSDDLEKIAYHFTNRNEYAHFSLTAPLVSKIRAFVEETGRTFILPETDLELSVRPLDYSGSSAYSQNECVQKLLGESNAKKNAEYLFTKGIEVGKIWFDHPTIPITGMIIRPLRLNSLDTDGIDAFNTPGDYGCLRRARGVQEIR